FHESWERLKDLIRKCPHHTVPKWQLVQCFHDGLTAQNRQMVDASCGTFMHKNVDEAWQLFESLSENSLHHLSSKVESSATGIQKKLGIYEVSQFETIKAMVDILSQKLDKVLAIGMLPTQSTQTSIAQEACTLCASPTHYMIIEGTQETISNPNPIHEKNPEESVSSGSGEKETVGQSEMEVNKASTSKESEQKGKEKDITFATPKVPFPECLPSPSLVHPFGKKLARMDEMIELFKQLQINLPLLDTIRQVPAYAKFLKDLCTTKRKLKTYIPKMVHLTEVSAVLSNKLPPKLKDPGAPLISCKIGNLLIDRALLDLGASVNILPSSVYDHFGFGELKPAEVTLQLADRSLKIPKGFIADVLVKVDELYFAVDFLVLDMETHANGKAQSIILGRPFLATANACINFRSGAMDISFGNKKLRIN
ncbi:LOW QUALITY PROTEIN: hypothetical protein CFOL_v3_26832, partial [Cephalotus follicularis]